MKEGRKRSHVWKVIQRRKVTKPSKFSEWAIIFRFLELQHFKQEMHSKVYQEVLNTKDKGKGGALGKLSDLWRTMNLSPAAVEGARESNAVFQGLKERTVSGKCYNLLKHCFWNVSGSFSGDWELSLSISVLKERLKEFSLRKEALRKDFRDIWEEGHGERWVKYKG